MAQLNNLIVTGSSRFLNPINGNARNGVYYVKGTQTGATGSWTGAIPIPALYDGLTIMYYLPFNGSGNATLNLTLSDGTTTGAKNCYYNTGRLTTHYGAGCNILMTYHPAGSITSGGSAITDDRWIADANYDTNTTYSMTRDGESVKLTPSSGSAQSISLSSLINGLGEGSSPAQQDDYLVAQYAGGGTTTTSYHRRAVKNIVNATNVKTALGTGSGTTKYLREDGTWQTPPGGSDTTYTLGTSGTTVTLTPSSGSVQSITTPYATYSNTVYGIYTANGGQQPPNYFGTNRAGFLMSNATVAGDSHYKNWLYMDNYNGSDVGGATAIGVDRTEPRMFIMQSDANRTSWNNTAAVGVFTATPTSGQVITTDGTTGGIKSSGYTIAKSVPSDAKFTDTTYSAGTGISFSGTTISSKIWEGTQAQYNALSSKPADTIYYITDAPSTPTYALASMSDVIISSPAGNQVLGYNGSKWVNTTLDTPALSDLSSVSISSPSNNQVLKYNGTTWVNSSLATVATSGSFNDLSNKPALNSITDVNISSAANNQVLTYSSGSWINKTQVWEGTQAQYNALSYKDPAVTYFITDVGDSNAVVINDLTDVDIINPSSGQLLMYDSDTHTWRNSTQNTTLHVRSVSATHTLSASSMSANSIECNSMSVQDISSQYTITKTSGNWSVKRIEAHRCGNIIFANFVLKGNGSAVSAGSNGFVGNITAGALPIVEAKLWTFIGSTIQGMNITATGAIICRNLVASATFSESQEVIFTGTFITDD